MMGFILCGKWLGGQVGIQSLGEKARYCGEKTVVGLVYWRIKSALSYGQLFHRGCCRNAFTGPETGPMNALQKKSPEYQETFVNGLPDIPARLRGRRK
ncbi:hypothetical protein D2U14_00890 [Lacticaseibacillus paracasei]|nr:hypothetical protein D2U14_00890 [Lacticaseibacillus paracasei]